MADMLDEDAELFERNRAEVQLLFDHIAGRPGVTLRNPPDPTGAIKPGLADDVAEAARLCFGPATKPEDRAEAALKLLEVRDRLSGLAYPARSLTIAYSAMFSGVVRLPPLRNRLASAMRRMLYGEAQDEHGKAAEAQRQRSLVALSTRAWPGLVPNARAFRFACTALGIFTLLFLLLTAFTYWDVAYGRTLIQRIEQADKDLAGLARGSKPPDEAACAAADRAGGADCVQFGAATRTAIDARHDLAAFAHCDGMFCFSHPLNWGVALCGYSQVLNLLQTDAPEHAIAPIIAVFGTYVLPMMFGYIGTFTSAFRAVRDRMRDSTLGPQDFVMVLMSVPTGVVAGVAVGLFYPAPDSTMAVGAFATSLTAGGIAFLAGYGAEAFFKVLDSLPERVFRTGPPAPPTALPQRPPA